MMEGVGVLLETLLDRGSTQDACGMRVTGWPAERLVGPRRQGAACRSAGRDCARKQPLESGARGRGAA
jgi:hypothetical protein